MQPAAGPSSSMGYQMDIEEVDLHNPDLNDLRDILAYGLTMSQNFFNVTVESIRLDSSELLQQPFYLAEAGLGGNTAILDVGDLSYWQPQRDITKVYNIEKILHSPKLFPKYSFIFGNGFDRLCNDLVINESYKVDPYGGRLVPYIKKNNIIYTDHRNYYCHVEWLPLAFVLECCMKGTFFLCQGGASQVIKIYAKANTSIVKSPQDFTNLMQVAILQGFGTSGANVALGGIFKVDTNRGWRHIVTRQDWQSYAKYCYCVKSSEPIISIFNSSTETSASHSSGSSSIRSNVIQSTHGLFHQCYADNNNHLFNENELVEFTGYFRPAQKLYRVINPIV